MVSSTLVFNDVPFTVSAHTGTPLHYQSPNHSPPFTSARGVQDRGYLYHTSAGAVQLCRAPLTAPIAPARHTAAQSAASLAAGSGWHGGVSARSLGGRTRECSREDGVLSRRRISARPLRQSPPRSEFNSPYSGDLYNDSLEGVAAAHKKLPHNLKNIRQRYLTVALQSAATSCRDVFQLTCFTGSRLP